MEKQLKIAVFIDFDNIEIGVKSTLQRDFDVASVLEALKERGEIVTKIAYANWGRQDTHTRALSEHAVQMVQRDPSPRGDKNGADINLALDALEMAFTHDHINAFAIVSGDSDFIALVNKLKQYDKTVFVVGGRAFTSTILQKNCHEFVSYESLMDEPREPRQALPEKREHHEPRRHDKGHYEKREDRRDEKRGPQQGGGSGGGGRRPALDLAQAMPLVERALQVLERREVRPQLGLLKSTMLQLDSSFSEKAYGATSFTDFVEKLRKADYVAVTGGEGRYMIQRKHAGGHEKIARPETALPALRDVLENHRIEMEEGAAAEELETWFKEEQPNVDWKNFGFQEFGELLNFAQDKGVVRIQPDETKGLMVHLGAEFHPPAVPDAPPPPAAEPDDERQPVVKGQPTAREPRVKRVPRKTVARTSSLATDLPVVEGEEPEFEPDAEPDSEPEDEPQHFQEATPAREVAPPPPPVEEAPPPPPKKATRKLPAKRTSRRIKSAAPPAEEPAAAEPEAPSEE
jgi:uncharacterized protein (TIGR00288 family)